MASNKKDKYSIGNSRSPMIFRKKKGKSKNMSRSLDDLISSLDHDDAPAAMSEAEWPELASVRRVGPVVMCILPAFSADFVCSALLSVGATPLITDNEQDVVKDLRNSRAILVDMSAPTHLIHALMDSFDPTGDVCMVVAATQVGSNDRKRDLTVEVIDRCGPSLVTGRLADIYALGQVVVERAISSDSGDECGESPHINVETDQRKTSAPDLRIPRRFRQTSPRKESIDELGPHSSPHGSPSHVSPRASPRTSPHGSPHTSPRHSQVSPLTKSPRSSPCGARKLKKGGGRGISRMHTIHPRVTMKGQFQDCSMLEVNVDDALQYGHKLAAHSRASIYLYETNLLTDGETDIEIHNAQQGTKYLHSLLPCSAAIAAACVSSVLRETEDIEEVLLRQFSHALALWCVAIQEAGNHANQKGRILPGTMRQALIDALHYLDEPHVRSTAQISAYCMRNSGPRQERK